MSIIALSGAVVAWTLLVVPFLVWDCWVEARYRNKSLAELYAIAATAKDAVDLMALAWYLDRHDDSTQGEHAKMYVVFQRLAVNPELPPDALWIMRRCPCPQIQAQIQAMVRARSRS